MYAKNVLDKITAFFIILLAGINICAILISNGFSLGLVSAFENEANIELAAVHSNYPTDDGLLEYCALDEEVKDEDEDKNNYVKWVDFNVPLAALERAMQLDIKSHNDGNPISWIELLALTATKLYGNWRNYKQRDMNDTAQKMLEGEDFKKLKDSKTFKYFFDVYDAVLSGFLGRYTIEAPDPNDKLKKIEKDGYGLMAFSPIAYGYGFSHYDDFGSSRSFGYRRRHLGHDMMGQIGTPIIAVESGTIEELGWNRYGGWRIGIRSFDKKRYYYYAHLRKGRPFASGLEKGKTVVAGDVIGYLGMSGYSTKEDTNNINVPHLHFGLQLIFDESQKDGAKEIWIDVYSLTKLLEKNRSKTVYNKETKEHTRKYNFVF